MKFEYYSEIQSDIAKKLSEQGVSTDDWDYMLFFEEDEIELVRERKRWRVELTPKDDGVSRLLTGRCSNIWYPVNDFMGRKGVLGVAYHA
jgi:hypothetical protein